MNQEHLLLIEAAKLLSVKPYRITYALSVGLVPEPLLRIANKRIFQEDDIARLRKHFQTPDDEGAMNEKKASAELRNPSLLN